MKPYCLPYNLYCVGGDVKHCSLTHPQRNYSSVVTLLSRPCALYINVVTNSFTSIVIFVEEISVHFVDFIAHRHGWFGNRPNCP